MAKNQTQWPIAAALAVCKYQTKGWLPELILALSVSVLEQVLILADYWRDSFLLSVYLFPKLGIISMALIGQNSILDNFSSSFECAYARAGFSFSFLV